MKKLLGLLSAIALLISACQKEMTKEEKNEYTAKGIEIAQATFKEMSGELEKKMKEGGVSKAAPFCHGNAENITNGIAGSFNVNIKRTSNKLRNLNNAPNDEEQAILNKFQALLKETKKLKPVVEIDQKGKPHFYAPIRLKRKCLACHGVVGETMEYKADSIIKILYPNDKAVGFKEDDLRGIWSITFNPKKEL